MEHLGQFIINHWQLWLAFVVILSFVVINELFMLKKKAKAISPQALVQLMNNDKATIIDLRDKEAFSKGHIIDSIAAKAEDFDQDKMNKYKSKPIVLVCAQGISAQTLASKIRQKGFQAMVLSGGIANWQASELPLVKGKG